jgi:ArsR family transcriptional regulator
MDAADTSRVLAALGHEGRLLIFRLLAHAGPEGLPAGEVARRTAQLQNTTSSNLAVLANVGLVAARREGRSVIYAVSATPFSEALAFLTAKFLEGPDVQREPFFHRLLSAARARRADRQAGRSATDAA